MHPFRVFKHPILLLYWVLLLALGGYLIYDYRTDYRAEITPVLESSIAEGTATARQHSNYYLTQVEMYTDAFPSEHNAITRRKAKTARKGVDACQELLQGRNVWDQVRETGNSAILTNALQELSDSLLSFANKDSVVVARLQTLVTEPAAALKSPETLCFFKYAHKSQVGLYLKDLAWKLELALNFLMPDLNDQVNPPRIRFDSLAPLVSYKQCARVGQPFTGEVYLQSYCSSIDDKLECRINGQKYPVRNGLVHLQLSFPSPGNYQQAVKICIKNPLTEELRTYTKTFDLTIYHP